MVIKLDTFTRDYIECMLWSSTDDNGDPIDSTYGPSDLADETLATIIDECRQFQDDNADDLAQAGDAGQNGHDFWLTRNGHGAGFWDRGYDAAISKRLTDAAHAWGTADLYVGDDGKLYLN